ncbi:MAG: hypothetical protein GWN30_05690, partial [Gammaproteobacteria bacterium]|nr:glycosyltransferase family 2 protein [Phycisphaerae bacterium]NIW44267.1 hypothetical protein [Gammaproteobacteria bacterium]
MGHYNGGLPGITCYCPTFARESLLEESLHSFLLQDYEGEKELIIVNGNPEQKLVFDHPEVTIYNAKKRFPTVASKQLFAIERGKYPYRAPWASDDIHLPHRLSFSIKRMPLGGPVLHIKEDPRNYQYYAPGKWVMCYCTETEDSNIMGMRWTIKDGYDVGACIYGMEAFETTKPLEEGSHVCIENIIDQRFRFNGYWSHDPNIDDGDTFYIYRRFTEHEHWLNGHYAQQRALAELGIPPETRKERSNMKLDYLRFRNRRAVEAGRDWLAARCKTGTIHLEPHWKTKYDIFPDAYRGEIRVGHL